MLADYKTLINRDLPLGVWGGTSKAAYVSRRQARSLSRHIRRADGKAPVIERKCIGLVGVDSGTMVLGDPTYLLSSREQSKHGIDYQEVIDAPIEPVQDFGGRPILLFQDFGGDGTFPVFGDFED